MSSSVEIAATLPVCVSTRRTLRKVATGRRCYLLPSIRHEEEEKGRRKSAERWKKKGEKEGRLTEDWTGFSDLCPGHARFSFLVQEDRNCQTAKWWCSIGGGGTEGVTLPFEAENVLQDGVDTGIHTYVLPVHADLSRKSHAGKTLFQSRFFLFSLLVFHVRSSVFLSRL